MPESLQYTATGAGAYAGEVGQHRVAGKLQSSEFIGGPFAQVPVKTHLPPRSASQLCPGATSSGQQRKPGKLQSSASMGSPLAQKAVKEHRPSRSSQVVPPGHSHEKVVLLHSDPATPVQSPVGKQPGSQFTGPISHPPVVPGSNLQSKVPRAITCELTKIEGKTASVKKKIIIARRYFNFINLSLAHG